MSSSARRRKFVVLLFAAGALLAIVPGQAEAQFGMGFGGGGFGLGFGLGFNSVPKPDSFLYEKAITDSQRDTHVPSRNVYASNPNSYINHVRDNGFVDRYPVARRDADYYRYSPPPPSTRRMTPTAMNVTAKTPSLPLASFYNSDGRIVWPADSPTAGDLKEKRSAFDQLSQGVLAELKQNGVASIATVTDTRQKLLDYGRPALQNVREHETPRVADTFHLFLLSLYESLAQAVNPPAPAAVTPTAPSS